MSIRKVNEDVINGINQGDHKSFEILYDNYFVHLCSYSISFVLDRDKSEEIVNDVFFNIWQKRSSLSFPIHSYLLTSVRNASLNHLRSAQSRKKSLDGYEMELLSFHEEYCLNGITPLKEIELKELKEQILLVVNQLPEKCQLIFKEYLYKGKSPKEIAELLGISVNTVRVQIKIAIDRVSEKLKPIIGLFMFFMLKKANFFTVN